MASKKQNTYTEEEVAKLLDRRNAECRRVGDEREALITALMLVGKRAATRELERVSDLIEYEDKILELSGDRFVV